MEENAEQRKHDEREADLYWEMKERKERAAGEKTRGCFNREVTQTIKSLLDDGFTLNTATIAPPCLELAVPGTAYYRLYNRDDSLVVDLSVDTIKQSLKMEYFSFYEAPEFY